MKKIIAASAVAAATILSATAANAESFVSIGYGQISVDLGPLSIDTNAITIRGGWNQDAGPWGWEVEGSLGAGDETISTAPTVTFGLKQQIAAYGVASIHADENFRFFGRLGYGSTEFESNVLGSASDTSINYGVGAQYDFGGGNGVRLDFTKYDFNDGGDASYTALAYVRSF